MSAEEDFIKELAENGTDKQRELFLKFQQERNKQMEIIVTCIAWLADGTVHIIGLDTAKEIFRKLEEIKTNIK